MTISIGQRGEQQGRDGQLFGFHETLRRSELGVVIVVPGTERQIATMEEMKYVAGVAARQNVLYQVREVAPSLISHYVPRENI